MIKVRVRGIYATGISSILIRKGFKLADVSEKIRERLGLEAEEESVDVTVKTSDEDLDELLVIGFPREAEEVYKVLVDELKYVYTWKSPVELHAVYLGVVVEKRGDYCTVDVGGFKGVLYPCKDEEAGSRVVVGVKKTPLKPGETLVLTKAFRLVGQYTALIHGEPKITFSEHITDAKVKARLSAIAVAKLMNTGLGIRFRSSSKYASEDAIKDDIGKLLAEYKDLLEKAKSMENAPAKLRSGEFIAVLGLTSLAKRILDEERRRVLPTIEGHHSLKSMGLSDIVDAVECAIAKMPQTRGEGVNLNKYIVEKLQVSNIRLKHVKPTGEIIELQPGRLHEVAVVNGGIRLVLERTIRSHGTYDGLGLEKKPGDMDFVVIDTRKPYIVHNYFRSSNWIGSYINVNTPPEVAPDVIKYHDLLVDIVVFPPGEVKVVDKEELDKALSDGIITEQLYNYALKAVEEVLSNPVSYVYNPYTKQ